MFGYRQILNSDIAYRVVILVPIGRELAPNQNQFLQIQLET